MFDFEMTCQAWYIHDIASVLYYAHFIPSKTDRASFEAEFMHHFWIGYETEYQLPLAERERIPAYLLYRDLLVFGYLCKVWGDKALSETEIKYKQGILDSIASRRAALEGF